MQKYETFEAIHREPLRVARILDGVRHVVAVELMDGQWSFLSAPTARMARLTAEEWVEAGRAEFASTHEVSMVGGVQGATYTFVSDELKTKRH